MARSWDDLRDKDRAFVKQKLKAIKEAKKRGDEIAASKHADELWAYLGVE